MRCVFYFRGQQRDNNKVGQKLKQLKSEICQKRMMGSCCVVAKNEFETGACETSEWSFNCEEERRALPPDILLSLLRHYRQIQILPQICHSISFKNQEHSTHDKRGEEEEKSPEHCSVSVCAVGCYFSSSSSCGFGSWNIIVIVSCGFLETCL